MLFARLCMKAKRKKQGELEKQKFEDQFKKQQVCSVLFNFFEISSSKYIVVYLK